METRSCELRAHGTGVLVLKSLQAIALRFIYAAVIFVLVFRLAMADLSIIDNVGWALSACCEGGLLAVLLRSGNYRRFPTFTTYIAAAILQGALVFAAYRYFGFESRSAYAIFWASQAAVTVVRALAVLELCRHTLAGYSGIWALISKILVATFGIVALSAMAVGGHSLGERVLSADRALSLAVAVGIITLFLLAGHYRVRAKEPMRSMAVGFFLYCCFVMLNDTLLMTLFGSYESIWNFLGLVAFIGSLLVWCRATWRAHSESEVPPDLLSTSAYRKLSPEVNLQLRVLNERLTRLAGQKL